MTEQECSTKFNVTKFDRAVRVTHAKDMAVQGFCAVGRDKVNSRVCYFVKNEAYPDGKFYEIGGEESFWDGAEVFASPTISVWPLWCTSIALIPDDREPIDEDGA